MGKETTTEHDNVEQADRDHSVEAAEKKVTAKKAAKKKSKKKAAGKKSKAAKAEAAAETPAPSPAPPVTAPPRVEPVFARPSDEDRASGPMRGIVALWGPLAIVVLLIVVSRLGDDDPGELADRAAEGISSSLDRVEDAARDVVEDVQDALTGGDPQAAAALGAGGRGSSERDLAAAFQDAGVTSPAAALPPAPSSTAGAEPWRDASQPGAPTSLPAVPGELPPQPENPWAPTDSRTAALPGESYPPAGGIAAPGAPAPPAPGYGYQGGYAGEPPPPAVYPPRGYAAEAPPGYAGRAPSYSQQQAWGAPPPGYTVPPGYGPPPGYAYPPQPYAPPPAYPPGYYPPAQ
jgi:hypothetical protein